jgi:hypothetical protein
MADPLEICNKAKQHNLWSEEVKGAENVLMINGTVGRELCSTMKYIQLDQDVYKVPNQCS